MPKFKIGGSMGYAGTSWEDEIEADTLEEAQEYAWERAIERVESWAEELPETDEEDGNDDQS